MKGKPEDNKPVKGKPEDDKPVKSKPKDGKPVVEQLVVEQPVGGTPGHIQVRYLWRRLQLAHWHV